MGSVQYCFAYRILIKREMVFSGTPQFLVFDLSLFHTDYRQTFDLISDEGTPRMWIYGSTNRGICNFESEPLVFADFGRSNRHKLVVCTQL